MRRHILLLASGLAITPICPAQAQTVVPDEPACGQCRIVIEYAMTLGEVDGPGILAGLPEEVIVDGRGRYWVLPGAGLVPLVFDSAGTFVRQVGRRGRGPGEFVMPNTALALPGDSVLVFDYGTMRGTVITPEFEPARSVSLPPGQVRQAVSVSWPGAVLINAIVRTPEHLGWPLHTVTLAGPRTAMLRSFGRNGGELRPGFQHELYLTLSRPRSGHVWVGEAMRYSVARWNAEGEQLAALHRQPSWFPDMTGRLPGEGAPPPPRVSGLFEDREGLLWVFILVATPSWRDALPPTDPGETGFAEVPVSRIAFEKMFTTRIEVIDPRAGRVVARGSYDHPVIAALGEGRAAAYAVRPDGVPVLRILNVRVQR